MKNFWKKLERPFLVQAPMENVTDTVFRQIIARAHRPDVFFTEFTNTDGMISQDKSHVMHRLQYTQIERPIVAQIWGNNPDNYFKAAKLLEQIKFDGIDINMGCPIRDVVRKGQCAGLMQNPTLAKEIIAATKDGVRSTIGRLPVSVKTRIGFNKIQTEEWISFLLEQNIDALTIHGRTVREQSKVPAHWDEIGKAVQIRNKMKKPTVIIGNGDVESWEQAQEKSQTYGVDGVMIGRGIFHNLFVFDKNVKRPFRRIEAAKTESEKIQMLIKHIKLFDKTWGKSKNFEIMKKFYKIYINDFKGAAELRLKLMDLHTAKDTIELLQKTK